MGMCCKKKTMIGQRNVFSMKWGGARPRGRPKKTWREIVENDSPACKWNREDAVDRNRWWRNQILVD